MDYLSPLPEGVSLIAFLDGAEIFRSGGKWLHPLFDLRKMEREEGELSIHDTVSGTAAAFLAASIGVSKVHANLASRGAARVYERFGIDLVSDEMTERIFCKTESLLDPEMPLEDALAIVDELAGRA